MKNNLWPAPSSFFTLHRSLFTIMNYYDDPKNVETYVQMADGYDGRALIDVLKTYLPEGATVLELGMGPGVDLDILHEYFMPIGSDRSQLFLDRYLQKKPDADLILLDAETINLDRCFDAIYSNKVLHHLSREALKNSLVAQAKCLNEGGLLFHAMWYGDREEEHVGMKFIYYTEETLKALLEDTFEFIAFQCYTEMEDDDSFYVILRSS